MQLILINTSLASIEANRASTVAQEQKHSHLVSIHIVYKCARILLFISSVARLLLSIFVRANYSVINKRQTINKYHKMNRILSQSYH